MADPSPFEPRGDFINGEFVLPDRTEGEIALEDPGDLDALSGAFPYSAASVDAAVDAARRAWPEWRDMSFSGRAECLQRFAEAMEAERNTFAELIAREIGKPLWEAKTEVAAMIAKVGITLGPGMEEVRDREVELTANQLGRWRAHSRGVLSVHGPFNFPGHLVNGHVAPALATGNTVVIKPSEMAPAVGQLYAELAMRAGFPPGVFNMVQGEGTQGARLAEHPDVDGVLFTGSYNVGRRILEATMDQPRKLVALELGGKNAVLVCDDGDVDAAASAIAFGACATTGQRCSATSRVFAMPEVIDRLTKRLIRIFGRVKIGYAQDEDVFMGPLVSAAARERHMQVLRWARDEGAELLCEGGPCEGDRPGHYVRPTVHRVQHPLRDSRYQTEEHFVPDIFICPVQTVDEGIAAIDATDYGLVASVFTADRDIFERCHRETRVGLINWNLTTVGASSKLPFGGVKKSGNDRPAGSLSAVYCTYPVASLETEEPDALHNYPGFPKPR